MRMIDQVLYIASRSGEEVVDTEDAGAIRQEALAQVRTEKPSTTRNQYARFKMHVPQSFLWTVLCSANQPSDPFLGEVC
jgi:hypothetical protein